MQLAITNTSATEPLELPYLEKTIKPGATLVFETPQSELCKMVDLQQAVAAGLASYQVTPTADETASGVLYAGVPEATNSTAGLQPAIGKLKFSDTLVAGSGVQPLISYLVPANTRLTLGINWNVYNTANKLAGYETVVVERVGTAAPTILSAVFDAATNPDAPLAWAPGSVLSSTLVISVNSLLVKIIADTTSNVKAKVELEVLSTTDISDAPIDTLTALIALLNFYGGSLYFATSAVDDGAGLATSIADSCVGARHATFKTTGAFVKPAIGTLTDGVTPAIILSAHSAIPASSLGTANTSHTVIYCGELSAPANFGTVVFGGTGTGDIRALFSQADGVLGPGIFDVTDVFVCTAPTSTTALQTLVWRAKASDNTGVILRNGHEVANGEYAHPTALGAANTLWCPPNDATWGTTGKMVATIYVPAAMTDTDIALAYGYLKSLFAAASLP